MRDIQTLMTNGCYLPLYGSGRIRCNGIPQRSYHFDSEQNLEKILQRYAQIYNQQIPQQAFEFISPMQTPKNWQ